MAKGLFHNLGLKILALVIAIFLWVLVTRGISLV